MRLTARQPLEGSALSGIAGRCGGVLRSLIRSCSAGLVLLGFVILPASAQSQNVVGPPASTKQGSSFSAQKPFSTPKKIDKGSPLLLEGDELIYDTKNNRVIARGDVRIYYGEYALTADQVTYDQSANTLIAQGNVKLKDPDGAVTSSNELTMTADFRDAFIDSLKVVGKDETRVAARRAVRKDGNVTEFEQGKFTPCKSEPGQSPLWCVSAQRIIHDQQAATITYQDAQFELFGVPILYLPYFSHADPSVKRATGFLAPTYSYNSTLGYSAHVPYYFALSPNYDFLFHPHYFSKHGVLWQGDWRQKVAFGDVRGEFTIKGAAIDQDGSTLPDTVTPDKRRLLDGWRGSVQSTGNFSLASWWRFGWDVTLESDDTFRRFYKLDNILQTDRINTAWLEGISDRNYFGMRFYHFGGLLIEDTAASESRVHPVIDYNYIVGQPVLGGELSFAANALSLSRSDGSDMNRASVLANWRRKMIDPIGQVWTPFVQARADVTSFTNGFDQNAVAVPEDTITRAMAAAGITYAYPFVYNTATASHVVEPIAQIVARPAHISQQRIPNEDAKSLVFDDTTVFEIDKFSGWDRIETGTRANVGVQYTFQANTGGYVRLFAARSFHLGGENPYAIPGASPTGASGTVVSNFTAGSGLETNRSDYVLGTYVAPVSNFRVIAQGRFDEDTLDLRRANVTAVTSYGPASFASQYSFAAKDSNIGLLQDEQEILGALAFRLTDRWSVSGMLRFDIDQQKLLQDQLQLKYADECFVLTATYTETRFENPTLDIKPDRSLMLRFELKHLGDFNYKTDAIDSVFGPNQPAR